MAWLFHRKFSVALAGSRNYDNIEGLVTMAGVVSALLLSLVLGFQYTTGPENHFKMDFKVLICAEEGFRSFAIEVMKNHDTGTYKEEHRQKLVPIAADGGDLFNVTSTILDDIPKRYPGIITIAGETQIWALQLS